MICACAEYACHLPHKSLSNSGLLEPIVQYVRSATVVLSGLPPLCFPVSPVHSLTTWEAEEPKGSRRRCWCVYMRASAMNPIVHKLLSSIGRAEIVCACVCARMCGCLPALICKSGYCSVWVCVRQCRCGTTSTFLQHSAPSASGVVSLPRGSRTRFKVQGHAPQRRHTAHAADCKPRHRPQAGEAETLSHVLKCHRALDPRNPSAGASSGREGWEGPNWIVSDCPGSLCLFFALALAAALGPSRRPSITPLLPTPTLTPSLPCLHTPSHTRTHSCPGRGRYNLRDELRVASKVASAASVGRVAPLATKGHNVVPRRLHLLNELHVFTVLRTDALPLVVWPHIEERVTLLQVVLCGRAQPGVSALQG